MERMIASFRYLAGRAIFNDGQRRVGRPSALGRREPGRPPFLCSRRTLRFGGLTPQRPHTPSMCSGARILKEKLSITDLGWWVGINYAGARCGPADEQQRSNNRHGSTQSKRMNGSLCCLLIAEDTHVRLLAIVSRIRAWALKLPMPRLPTELTDPLS